MDIPRLKINDKEIGLRDLGNNLFEPKSISILQKSIYDGKDVTTTPKFFTEKSFPEKEPRIYHKIQSFCFVTTDNIKREAAMMIKSLRKFHTQPVYVICDQASRTFLTRERLHDNLFFKLTAEKEDLEKIQKKFFKNHECIANNIHRPAEILKKMEVMNFALESHDNTFFLDSDIIVLDNLQEYFQDKVALSPHYYPKQYSSHGFENGFYNAGYVFCASKGFPNFWKHIYLNDSIFFEQECMNRIPDMQAIQTFSREHNVGFWRRNEIPKKVKSLHFHISDGVDRNRPDKLKEMNEDIKTIGVDIMRKDHPDLYNYYVRMSGPKKVAFVHYGKTAGVYINEYMKDRIFRPYQKYLSWHINLNPFGVKDRDWTQEELSSIAKTNDEYAFTSNHHIEWSIDSVKKFKNNNWFMFTFLRRPEELLCSLYHWSKENNIELCASPAPKNLEQIFEYAINNKDFDRLWKLPNYIHLLDYVAEFNDENFGNFLLNSFGEEYTPREKLNISKNKGFDYYRENGEISEEAISRLFEHPEYLKYSQYLDQQQLTFQFSANG